MAISGWWNLCAGGYIVATLLVPGLGQVWPAAFWGWILVGVLGVTGVVLVLCSRDLQHRASIVYWEALARLAAAVLLGVWGAAEVGLLAYVIGGADLVWGLVMLIGLPRGMGVRAWDLVLDRPLGRAT